MPWMYCRCFSTRLSTHTHTHYCQFGLNGSRLVSNALLHGLVRPGKDHHALMAVMNRHKKRLATSFGRLSKTRRQCLLHPSHLLMQMLLRRLVRPELGCEKGPKGPAQMLHALTAARPRRDARLACTPPCPVPRWPRRARSAKAPDAPHGPPDREGAVTAGALTAAPKPRPSQPVH